MIKYSNTNKFLNSIKYIKCLKDVDKLNKIDIFCFCITIYNINTNFVS